MRRRTVTLQAPTTEVDVLALGFTCTEDSTFAAVGRQSKEMRWRVGPMGAMPMEVCLSIEKQAMFDPEVRVTVDGRKIYPTGTDEKSKLKEDFVHKWSFRGQANNLDKKSFWEVRPKAMGDNWFPASSLSQKPEGCFEATVWLPDGAGGAKQLMLPEVEAADIREEQSKQPLTIPARSVFLRIPKADPMGESRLNLLTDGTEEEPLTYSFGRPTPPAGPDTELQPASRAVLMELTKDRKHVTTSVSHELLASYMAMKPTAVSRDASSKVKASWKIMVGPYAEHTIAIEKKAVGTGAKLLSGGGGLLSGMKQVTEMAETALLQKSQIVSLVVDGRVLAEGTSDDFDADWETVECPNIAGECEWLCRFKLTGKRSVMFKVFETNEAGMTLDSTDLVEGLNDDQRKINKVCTVSIKDLADLSTAHLDIDGVHFGDLREFAAPAGAPISCEPEILGLQYSIQAPNKIRDIAPLAAIQEKLQAGGAALASKIKEQWEQSQPGLLAFGGKIQENMGQWFGTGAKS